MEMETISTISQIDEQHALVMSMQALLDSDMLAIVAAVIERERNITELAETFKAVPSFSRGPIGRLIFLEIVTVREEDGRIMCGLNRQRLHALNGMLQRLSKELFAVERPVIPGADALAEDEQRVLRTYLRGEQIVELPAGSQRLQVILKWLAARFEPGRRYPEREVNELIKRHHPDFATLRRLLVDYRYMAREREVYWRVEDE